MGYAEERKDLRYYKIVRDVLMVLGQNAHSVIDVGSRDVDILSALPMKTKVCLDKNLLPPPSTDAGPGAKLTLIKADWLEWNVTKPFDVICCLQVLEHLDDTIIRVFTQKLFASGKIVIISVPYKWTKGACKYHLQDPVDEAKLAFWTKRTPDISFFSDNRLICLYFQEKASLLAFQDALFQPLAQPAQAP